ncbi:hypothetical protein HK098_007460 [Nowakowskiella sp. JEL0407]|nr:hypothetical protein HK098_007460 [Nowakowskiella sp. JEL0407]
MSITVGNSEFRPLPTSPEAKITGVHESLLQDCEKDIIWYRENFIGKPHLNYLSDSSPKGPLAISILLDADTYKILLRSNLGSERLSIPKSNISVPFFRKLLGLGAPISSIINLIDKSIPAGCLKLIKDVNLPGELLAMEERQVIRSYKFGVIYLKDGQSTEIEALSNTHESTSQAFRNFLNFLGESIELKGWKGYRAGLDVSGTNLTGTKSVYTKWQGYEIMFHVSTLLPYSESDKQQLERKRHIGNDIVIIAFQDTDKPFQLQTITSHQNHVAMVVQPSGQGFKFTVVAKVGVPTFTPDIPEPAIISTDAVSRDFFLHKRKNCLLLPVD